MIVYILTQSLLSPQAGKASMKDFIGASLPFDLREKKEGFISFLSFMAFCEWLCCFEFMLDNTYCCSLFLDACVMLIFFNLGQRFFEFGQV